MDHAAAFRAWVLEPARTPDELHLAELLVEQAESLAPFTDARSWKIRQKTAENRRRKHALDPAYRPRFSSARLDAALVYWPRVLTLEATILERRPVRDLSALRFVPTLRELALRTELRDLSPLALLPDLRKLRLREDRLTDLTGLRRLPHLETVDLEFGHPWPDPAGLEALTACRQLTLTLSALHLETVSLLPLVEDLRIHADGHLPLRDFRRLPEMPALRKLEIETADLAGIDRYPTLEVATIKGVFDDLSPLASLPRLRELTLRGENFEHLAPLARLPELRLLTLERKRGLLLDPLLEAPRLRRVLAPGNRVLATELASLNAAIGWSAEDFFLETARPLAPLRVLVYESDHPDARAVADLPAPPDPRLAVPGHDATFALAEKAHLQRALVAHLDAVFSPGWGRLNVDDYIYANFYRDSVRLRAPEALEALRAVLARARHPWSALVSFEDDDTSHLFGPADGDEDGVHVETPEDVADRRRRILDERLRLEREHQWRLRGQGLVSPSPHAADPETNSSDFEDEVLSEDDEPSEEAPPGSPFSELHLALNEHHAWLFRNAVEAARAVLRVEPEDWHALPEPPEQRPRPE